jgi:hypothetical protein
LSAAAAALTPPAGLLPDFPPLLECQIELDTAQFGTGALFAKTTSRVTIANLRFAIIEVRIQFTRKTLHLRTIATERGV